jgi:phosphoglycolate phosphatase-like HAD superfamily hydrolase
VVEPAIIFDVDGVLLELTSEEEDIFFDALADFVPVHDLSRDWNSYRIRNDDDIIAEILERYHGNASRKAEVIAHYIKRMTASALQPVPIAGANALLHTFAGVAKLGIATANLLGVAQHRLQQAKFWHLVSHHAQGADGGGHKTQILARALATLNTQRARIVFIGDNLNDVAAGQHNGVQFIGFSEDVTRRRQLMKAGATHISAHHDETLQLLHQLLA